MLGHLIGDARDCGMHRLWLETGSMGFFEPARTLYAARGFEVCEPFGNDREDPNSVFMTMALG